MPLNTIPLPYGLRDVRITPFTDPTNTAYAALSIDLPNSQTFQFTDAEDFEDLRGDDKLQASHGKGTEPTWELGAGGISLEAWASIAGGTVTTTGVTPNQIKTYRKLITDIRPYFKVEGRAISDSGGDFHPVLYRCKATGDLNGSLEDGKFWITGAKGKGYSLPATIGSIPADSVYDLVQNETAVAIP